MAHFIINQSESQCAKMSADLVSLVIQFEYQRQKKKKKVLLGSVQFNIKNCHLCLIMGRHALAYPSQKHSRTNITYL